MTGRFSALSLRVLPALPGGGGGASPRLSGRRGVSAPHPCGHTRPQVPPRRFLCCFLSGSRSVRLLPHTLGLLSPYYPCYFPDEEINLEPSPLCPHHVTERPGSWRSPEPSLPEQSAPPPPRWEGKREAAGRVEGRGADRVEGAASVRRDYPAHSRCSISAPPSFLAQSRRAGGEGECEEGTPCLRRAWHTVGAQ